MREAIACKEDLTTLMNGFFAKRKPAPDLFSGATNAMLDCFVAGRAVCTSVTCPDPQVQQFLNGSRDCMMFDLLQSILSNDDDLQARQLGALAGGLMAMQAKGLEFEFKAKPQTPATPQAINITVQPAPVTVNNAFPTQAIQTVERDARDEIVATVTQYV